MRAPHFLASMQLAATAKLVWSRITSSRLTIAYFALTVVHFTLQLAFQIKAFTINAEAADFLQDIVVQGNATDGSLPVLRGNTLHMCSWLPKDLSVNIDACAVVWNGSKGSNVIGVQPQGSSTRSSYADSIPSSSFAIPSTSTRQTASPPPTTSKTLVSTSLSPTGTPVFSTPAITTPLDLVKTVTVVVIPTSRNSDLVHGHDNDDDEFRADFTRRSLPHIKAFEENGQVKVNITGMGFNHTPATLDQSCLWALNWPVSELHNTKREDLVFIGFQFWVLGMSIVALLNESIPHIAASLLTHLMATGWAVNQITTTQRFRSDFSRVITNGACSGVMLLPNFWESRGTAEMVVSALNIFALVVSAFLTWKLVKLFGWQTFKRVGASLTINRIYKIVLVLSIVIQLGLFFMLVTVSLWIDQLWNSPIGDLTNLRVIYKVIAIATLILLVPWLVTGWFAVRRELRVPMIIFLLLSVLYLAGWSLMLFSTTFRWTFVTWAFFGINFSASVFLAVVAFILGIVCRLNFGKGLPRYLNAHQSLSEDHGYYYDADIEKVSFPSANPVLAYPAVFEVQSESHSQGSSFTKGPRFFNVSAPPFEAEPVKRPLDAHVMIRKGSNESAQGYLSRSNTHSSSQSHGSLSSFYSYGDSGHSRQESKQRWVIE